MIVILMAYRPIPILLNEISDKPNARVVEAEPVDFASTLNIFKVFGLNYWILNTNFDNIKISILDNTYKEKVLNNAGEFYLSKR